MIEIELGKEKISLDENNLKFTEETVNQFIQFYASKYNYYNNKQADAQYLHSRLEDKYDALKADKFVRFKLEGGSDKFNESRVTSDTEVKIALEEVRIAKHKSQLLWGYLRSMDRAHEDAMNLCYNLRKELSALYPSTVNRT